MTRTSNYTSARSGAIPQHPDDENKSAKLRRAAWMALYDLWDGLAGGLDDGHGDDLSTDPDVIFEETYLVLNWLAVADKKDVAQSLVGVLGQEPAS